MNVIHAGSELTDSSWPLVALSCLQFYCCKLQIYIISISKIIEFESLNNPQASISFEKLRFRFVSDRKPSLRLNNDIETSEVRTRTLEC